MAQGVCVIAEFRDGGFRRVSYEIASEGRKLADELGEPLLAIAMGEGVAGTAADLFIDLELSVGEFRRHDDGRRPDAHALQEASLPSNVELEVLDGGTLPDAFLSIGEVDKLIIVDAVLGGDKPGTIYRFRPEDISLDDRILTSLHQISLLENLWLTERFGQKPEEIVIIGVEPEDMSWGLELSAKLQKRIPRIIKVALEEVVSDYPDNSEKGDSMK